MASLTARAYAREQPGYSADRTRPACTRAGALLETARRTAGATRTGQQRERRVAIPSDPRAHLVAVRPVLDGGTLGITELGRTSRRNAGLHPQVTLVWPPAEPSGYSLIVDGIATLRDDELHLAPTRAVLHRPAPAAANTPATDPAGCVADCVEIPVS